MVEVHACQISKNVDGFAFFLRGCSESRKGRRVFLVYGYYGTSRERVRDCVSPSSAELMLGVCCTDSCWCCAVLPATRLVRSSRHVMAVWEMMGIAQDTPQRSLMASWQEVIWYVPWSDEAAGICFQFRRKQHCQSTLR